MIQHPPTSTLFPYTTLFRSERQRTSRSRSRWRPALHGGSCFEEVKQELDQFLHFPSIQTDAKAILIRRDPDGGISDAIRRRKAGGTGLTGQVKLLANAHLRSPCNRP